MLLVGLTSCTTDVAAAAVVGDTQIKSADLDSRTESLKAQFNQDVEDASLIDLQRQDLSGRIRHQLLSDLGLLQSVDQAALMSLPDQLGGVKTVAGQLGAYSNEELLVRLQDLASQIALLSATAQAGTPVMAPSVTFDFVAAKSYSDAVAMKNQFEKDPASLTAAAEAAGSAGGGLAVTATPLTVGILTGTGVFGAKAGQVIIASLNGKSLVLRITKSEVVSTQLDPAALQKAGVPGIQGAAGLILAGLAGNVPVQVNPRYGLWDATTMQVVNEPGRR